MKLLCNLFLLSLSVQFYACAKKIVLTPAQALELGQKIWRNECNNSIEKLTYWKNGEDWASLGIGHFIWYPKNQQGPYTQTFPNLLKFLAQHNVQLPSWLTHASACPWGSKHDFYREIDSTQMNELRNMLSSTIDLQAQFIAHNLETVLPKLLTACTPSKKNLIKKHFNALTKTPQGLYALIDYLNFKGDGTNNAERYHDQGWGLLQVLETMPINQDPLQSFAQTAHNLLKLRVQHAPAHRNEQQWLKGWLNRVSTYLT